MRILIVEDDEDSRVYLERALRSQKYDVMSAGNGLDALEKAHQWQPDLVVADILMPEMNGFELCRRMKTDERLQNIPFIFYTATFVDREDEKLAMQLGASRFLIKPMENAEFFKIINEVVKEHSGKKLPVPDLPLAEMGDLCQMQAKALQRKLDKKVRDLAKEHDLLNRRNEELRALTTRLAGVAEEEERRLSRELHDSIGQNLVTLSTVLKIISNDLPAESEAKIRGHLQEAQALLQETTEHVRDLMAELRPPDLDDYGLAAALRWYVHRFSERTGVTVSFEDDSRSERLPPRIETAFFRIAQGALTNVARHASANHVELALNCLPEIVRLTVADNGVGFDPGVSPHLPGSESGWGLITMQERAESIGAHFNVESARGKGTCVTIELRR